MALNARATSPTSSLPGPSIAGVSGSAATVRSPAASADRPALRRVTQTSQHREALDDDAQRADDAARDEQRDAAGEEDADETGEQADPARVALGGLRGGDVG